MTNVIGRWAMLQTPPQIRNWSVASSFDDFKHQGGPCSPVVVMAKLPSVGAHAPKAALLILASIRLPVFCSRDAVMVRLSHPPTEVPEGCVSPTEPRFVPRSEAGDSGLADSRVPVGYVNSGSFAANAVPAGIRNTERMQSV